MPMKLGMGFYNYIFWFSIWWQNEMNEIRSASPQLINLGASKIKLARDIKIFMYSIEINKIPPSKITA